MDMMSKIETVLKSGESEDSEEIENNLIALVKGFLAENISKKMIIEQFSQLRRKLISEGRDWEEDIVVNILSYLEGWCGPHMEL